MHSILEAIIFSARSRSAKTLFWSSVETPVSSKQSLAVRTAWSSSAVIFRLLSALSDMSLDSGSVLLIIVVLSRSRHNAAEGTFDISALTTHSNRDVTHSVYYFPRDASFWPDVANTSPAKSVKGANDSFILIGKLSRGTSKYRETRRKFSRIYQIPLYKSIGKWCGLYTLIAPCSL